MGVYRSTIYIYILYIIPYSPIVTHFQQLYCDSCYVSLRINFERTGVSTPPGDSGHLATNLIRCGRVSVFGAPCWGCLLKAPSPRASVHDMPHSEEPWYPHFPSGQWSVTKVGKVGVISSDWKVDILLMAEIR